MSEPNTDKDVSALCAWANPDDELLPLTRCVCGVLFSAWDVNLSVYRDDPVEMLCCGRRLYFSNTVHVFEVLHV